MAAKKTPIRRHLKKVGNISNPTMPPKTVKALKKQYNDLPLHFLFGIEKEIDLQCPILNQYLDKLTLIKHKLQEIRNCKTLAAAQLKSAEALFHIEVLYEDIDEGTRGNFEKLRSSHEQWKRLAIRAMDDTQNPSKYVVI